MWKSSSGNVAVNWCLNCVSFCSPVKLGERRWPGLSQGQASRTKQKYRLTNMTRVENPGGYNCPFVSRKDCRITYAMYCENNSGLDHEFLVI